MTPNDFQQNQKPPGESDPLSATGMFLRAFDASAPAPSDEETPAPASKQPPINSQPTGPGEFTRIFQGLEARQSSATPTYPAQGAPSESAPQVSGNSPATSQATSPTVSRPEAQPSSSPGEFTRISISPLPVAPAAAAKTISEPPSSLPSSGAPPRLKGFSSPGISDSASADSSFTQFFKAGPVKPPTVSHPEPMAQASSTAQPVPSSSYPQAGDIVPNPRPVHPLPVRPIQPSEAAGSFAFGSEFKPELGHQATPLGSPSSATGMSSSFGGQSPSVAAPESRPPVEKSYQTEPLPTYRPTTSAPTPSGSEFANSGPANNEVGSVTQLIQRLSQAPKEPQPTPPLSASPSESSPGEFTRMISGTAFRTESAPSSPVPAGPSGAPTMPGVAAAAMPLPQLPKMPVPTPPTLHASGPVSPAAPHVPGAKIEMPVVAAPKLVPPALTAPQFKLPAIVPVLLVVNTFLLVVLLVVVIFAMRR